MSEVNKKRLGAIILVLVFGLSLCGAVLAGLFYYQKTYAERIYQNVYFGSINLSGLTKKQAAYTITKQLGQVLDREITLKAGDKSLKIRPTDTGVGYDVSEIVNSAYHIGRNGSIVAIVKGSASTLVKKESVSSKPRINKAHYDSFLNLTIPQLNTESKDATLTIENGQIVESPEVTGQEVITAGLPEQILKFAIDPSQSVLELETRQIEPKSRISDFTTAKQYATGIMGKKITLSYESFAFTPDVSDLGKWISFNTENNTYSASINDDNIKVYLNKIAGNFETQVVNRKVNALDNSVIVEGKAGKLLNKDKAVSDIKAQIEKSNEFTIQLETHTVDPKEERVIPAEGLIPGRFPGKYIDVDLAQQKLCLIEGNNIGNCYVVSTGKASTPTPVGTRIIDSKEERKWSNQFGLWMPSWQSLGGGYGIHELPEWPSGYKEGENHLGTPVSHGCIRLGVGPAQEVYNWTEIGTPVYIHK